MLKRHVIIKQSDIEENIASITGLATTAALTTVKTKIRDTSNLVHKTDHGAKRSNIESQYLTTVDYNKFTSQTVNSKIIQKELDDKSSIAGLVNK